MAKIKGQYIIRAALSDVVNGYTFTNADRNAELSAADDFMCAFSCDDIDRPINTAVSFNSKAKLRVQKARLITAGALGLQPALNSSVAAKLLFIGRASNDVAADALGGFTFGLDQFNEWQDVKLDYMPNEVINENYYLSLDHTYSKIFFDDYNLQSAYNGQTFNLFVELMIDTAGLFDNGGYIV